MDNSPLAPSEDGSDTSTERLSETKSDNKFRETQIEGSGHISTDVDFVSLDELRVEGHHREQGVRILIRSLTDSLHLRHIIPSNDKCEWIALRTEFPLHAKSISEQKPEHKVLAVRQSHDDVKFSFRIPSKTKNGQSWPPLWCEFYYDSTSDRVILLNRSDVCISIQNQSSIPRIDYTVMVRTGKRLALGTWRIVMEGTAILDFRILGRQEHDVTMAVMTPNTTLPTQSFLPQTDSHENKAKFNIKNPLLNIEKGQSIMVSGDGVNQYRLEKHDVISRSSGSTVYSAWHSKSSGLVAVKVLQERVSGVIKETYELSTLVILRQSDKWLREIKALKELQHKSIVRYYGHDARFLSIYMELVDAQDLAASPRWRINDDFQGSRGDALRIGKDISSGLSYIHRNGLVHNNIKPSNILYSPERGGVICDFGLSTTTSNPKRSGGTPYYIPPEFIGTRSRGMAGDIWGLGITMLYVLHKIGFPEKRANRDHPRRLYWRISDVNDPRGSAIQQMRDWISEVEIAKGTLNSDDQLERLAMMMLEMNPKKRITAKELVQSLFEEEPYVLVKRVDNWRPSSLNTAVSDIKLHEGQFGPQDHFKDYSPVPQPGRDGPESIQDWPLKDAPWVGPPTASSDVTVSYMPQKNQHEESNIANEDVTNLDSHPGLFDATQGVSLVGRRGSNSVGHLGRAEPHISGDDRPSPENFTCPECGKAFTRLLSLKRHQEEQHAGTLKSFPCPNTGCERSKEEKAFKRENHLKRHLEICKKNGERGSWLTPAGPLDLHSTAPPIPTGDDQGPATRDVRHPPSGVQLPFQKRLSHLYKDTTTSSDFIEEPFPNEEDPEIRDLLRKLHIQKDRLVSWGLEWSNLDSAEIDESLSNAGLSEVVTSVLLTIKDILTELEPLWLSFKHLTEPNRLSRDSNVPPVQWDKAQFEELVRHLTSSNDILYDLSRARSKAASRRPPPKVPPKDPLRSLEEDAKNLELTSRTALPLSSMGLPDIPQMSHLAEGVPPTDSGYASTLAKGSRLNSLEHWSKTPAHTGEELASDDASDTATQYSIASSVSFSRRNNLILELASDLFTKISSSIVDKNMQARVSTILPELLKAFALMLGYEAPSQMHREIMAFVHRNRRDIATAFMEIGFKQDDTGSQGSGVFSDTMDLQDRLQLWFDKEDDDEGLPDNEWGEIDPLLNGEISVDQVLSEDFGTDEANEEEAASEKWFSAYQDLLSGSEAYKWLLSRLRREFHLVPTEPNSIKEIRDKITALLPQTHKISRRESSQACRAVFEVQWDILGFFETQEYSSQAHEAFEDVITLTGSLQDAQAATCVQYIHQTWPSTGEMMIQLIKGVLQSGTDFYQNSVLPSETNMSAWIVRPKFMVEIQGTSATVTEVGEQLAWLGAALRTSPKQEGLIHCTPIIRELPREYIPPYSSQVRPLLLNMAFQLEFTMEDVPQALESVNGRCWHGIFRNPVVVRGYPIPRRAEDHNGLEVSLNIMAGLIRSRRIDRFKEKVYIKGFSAMLLQTNRSEENISWHLIYNKDGSRISYLDDSKFTTDQNQYTGRLDVEGFQHILGWCSEARFYAGSAEASHLVAHSGLPRAHAGCALAGIKVSPGRMILDGPKFATGAKDKPVHVSHKGIIRRLKWISSKFVLLWDKRDERGWLVNGTSALLHVVRASLFHSGKDPFRSAFLFQSKDMQEAEDPFTTSSAVEVLLNNHNRNLRLYEDDEEAGGYLLLRSQVDHFYNLLEKLIDHQTDIAGEDGMKLSDRPRKYLEGWDFEDLTTDCDPLRPRVATIGTAGKGWIDFIRAIHAVVLVGSGFGDIIRPRGQEMCETWGALPKNRFYIASCLSDLERLMKEAGGYDDRVWLTNKLICHTPSTLFISCRCRDGMEHSNDEPVQVLLPSALANSLHPRTDSMEPKGSGAVIFGHHSDFSWIWGDTGPPEQRELIEADAASLSLGKDSDSLKDSGIGLSPQPSMLNTRRLGGSGSEHLSHMTREGSAPSMERRRYSRDQYTVGIICALPKELMAVRVLFDAKNQGLGMAYGDDNQYALGEMASHRVVAACLPAGEYGTNSAASVASNMKRSFPSLRFCLLVGIAGGAPSEKHDIRLGDVVVGQPTGTNPGVLQYDLGKSNQGDSFQLTGVLQRPPRVLTNAINALRSDPELRADPLGAYLGKIVRCLPDYGRPGSELDILLPSPCEECDSRQIPHGSCSHVSQRAPRGITEPVIHYGIVASGNRVVKDAAFRDRLAHEYDVLCFEMEAAGVINTVDCLVIRGICDYCDAEKNNVWQEYAAATAAAYAKLLLGVVAAVEEDTASSGWRNDEEPAIKKRKWMPS